MIPKGYAATPLGCFDYEWLDANGGTKKIEEQLKLANDIFWRKADELKRKYAPLKDRYLDQIKAFEFALLDDDGGTSAMEQCLKDGYDTLSYQVEAVKEKYKHLLPLYNPRALLWKKEMEDPSRIGHNTIGIRWR